MDFTFIHVFKNCNIRQPKYDSLNLQLIEFSLNQIRQLFSYENPMPNFIQVKCYEQVGSTNCKLFATVYAVNILNGNNV